MAGDIIFVVMGSTGQGSSYYQWIVGYHTDRKEADKAAGAAQVVAKLKYREWMGDDTSNIDDLTNPFDPYMVVEPPGTNYYVYEVYKLGEHPGENAENDDQTTTECDVIPQADLSSLLNQGGSGGV
jgi:hypothetical protein